MLRRAARRGGCGRVRGQGRYCCCCRYCYGYCYRSHCGCGTPVGSDPTVPEGRLSHGGGWDIQARCEMRERERERESRQVPPEGGRTRYMGGDGRPDGGRAGRECVFQAGSTCGPPAGERHAEIEIVCPEVGSARCCRVPRKIWKSSSRLCKAAPPLSPQRVALPCRRSVGRRHPILGRAKHTAPPA